jgi:hypothetical protein
LIRRAANATQPIYANTAKTVRLIETIYDRKEPAMLELNQSVIVIADKGLTYEGYIMARATGENGAAAYRIGLEGAGFEQQGQWHKAGDVFVPEPVKDEVL